jgi:hypothetical protein
LPIAVSFAVNEQKCFILEYMNRPLEPIETIRHLFSFRVPPSACRVFHSNPFMTQARLQAA